MPAWYPCSFFEDQQRVYAGEYDIYNVVGNCLWLPKKKQLKRMLSLKGLSDIAESTKDSAVLATWKRELRNPVPLKTRVICRIKKTIGNDKYEKLHLWFQNTIAFKRIVLFFEHKGAIGNK